MRGMASDMCDISGGCAAVMSRPRASGPQHTTRPEFSYGRSHRRRRATIQAAQRRRTQRWSW
ncbi:MAG: hypothetical protein K8T91_12165 [Planctomycetes bacterium]|nr:hypothetical protein [Planctomycetota bacterium]